MPSGGAAGPSVTFGNSQQFSEYNEFLNGKAKPLPGLLRNVQLVSYNELPNPGHRIRVYLGRSLFSLFPFISFFFCTVSIGE